MVLELFRGYAFWVQYINFKNKLNVLVFIRFPFGINILSYNFFFINNNLWSSFVGVFKCFGKMTSEIV